MISRVTDLVSLLTANADTVYFVGIVELSPGPMVVGNPRRALEIFDDTWQRRIVAFGLPGLERNDGGWKHWRIRAVRSGAAW